MRRTPVIILMVMAILWSSSGLWTPPADRVIWWEPGVTVGVFGGIPNRTTIYTNVPPNSGRAGIQTAINNCPSNQVVNLHTNAIYDVDDTIDFNNRDGITLRMNNSQLRATAGIDRYITIGGDLNWSSRIDITSGWLKGASNLTLSSVSGVAVGQLCIVDQTNEAGLVWDRTGSTTRGMAVVHKVVAINGSVVTIWPPLIYSGPTNAPQFRFNTDHARYCSVENGWFNNNGNTCDEGIWLHQSESCWIDDVRMTNMNTYNVLITRSIFFEARNCVMNDSPVHGPNHAGFLVGSTSSDMGSCFGLYYNNIILRIFPGIELNRASGNVIAYNFVADAFYDGFGQGVGIDVNHLAHGFFNLCEGNICNMFQNDGYFGSGSDNSYWRNWAHGYVTHGLTVNGVPVPSNFNSKCFALNHYALRELLGANVSGYPTFNPVYYIATNDDYDVDEPTIYQFGYPNMGGNNYAGTFTTGGHQMTGEDQRLDYRVELTVYLHGNWDSYNRAVIWKGGQDQDLPASLYLTSQPSWWPTNNPDFPWPWMNPVTGYTNLTFASIPAGYKFVYGTNPPSFAGGGGSVIKVNRRPGFSAGRGRGR